MQQLIINIQDKYKAHWLADFLHELKFVSSVETLHTNQFPIEAILPDKNQKKKHRVIDEGKRQWKMFGTADTSQPLDNINLRDFAYD